MRYLSKLPTRSIHPLPRGARHAVQILEPKSAQMLVITSRDPLVAYQLDQEDKGRQEKQWAEGENHPDAVVLGTLNGRSYVCFIELKSSMKERTRRDDTKSHPAEHAFAQLEGGIRHFHPFGAMGGNEAHGDEHHEAWRSGRDPLDVLPDADHAVIGIAVGFRQVPRPPPLAPLLNLGGKRVLRVIVPIHGAQANQATIAFEELLKKAGVVR